MYGEAEERWEDCSEIGLLISALLITGCGPTSASITGKSSPSYKLVDAYRDLRLGSTFEDVIGSVDSSLFNPVSLKDCFRDLPINGCYLSRNTDDTVYEKRNGIPYGLELKFNSLDRLIDIDLRYRRQGSISGDQCKAIFARTVDWVSADYGPTSFRRPNDGWETEKSRNSVIATPAGNLFAVQKPAADGSYVTQFMHLATERTRSYGSGEDRQTLTLNRGLTLFATYIVVNGTPICDVSLSFSEPSNDKRSAEPAGKDHD